ncbi:MAG: hypothetical protein HYZ63_02915 [Candidatus Andersenbacteria bacterium]|nr:hypothetical protein [Candidatus Andersenbacteria bacterium]
MTDYERKLLGEVLVSFDELVNGLDRAVFETAYHSGVGNLEAQKAHAVDPAFQPPIKTERDRKMEQRNLIAKLLGFAVRQPHDLSPRDYVPAQDGLLVPRGALT